MINVIISDNNIIPITNLILSLSFVSATSLIVVLFSIVFPVLFIVVTFIED